MNPLSIITRRGIYHYRQTGWPSGIYRSLHLPATKANEKEAWRLASEEFRKSSEATIGKLTLRAYAARFYGPDCPHVADLLAEGKTITPRSLTDQEAIVKRDLMPLGVMAVRVCDLRPRHVKEARAEIVRAKGSTRAAQRAFVILRTILRTAFEHELVAHDPLAGVATVKYSLTVRSDLTPEQTAAFFQRENFRSDAAYALFRLAYLTGMRRAEVCAMDRSQDQGGALRVDRAFKDDAFTVVGPPKWGKVRDIAVTAPLRAHLDWWYSRTPFVHDGRLFPMATPGFWRREFAFALKAAGIVGVVPHSLRHTLASDLDEQGVPAAIIRETMGHGTEAMRARYTHVRRGVVAEEMEVAMQRIVGGSR